LREDFDNVTRALNEIDEVIDMDRNVSREQYISTQYSIVRKETVLELKKCFILKVSPGRTVLTRLLNTFLPCK
jgi:hypothetical protein